MDSLRAEELARKIIAHLELMTYVGFFHIDVLKAMKADIVRILMGTL